MHEFWHTATQARVDMIFSACMTMSFGGFFLWSRNVGKVARATCYLLPIYPAIALLAARAMDRMIVHLPRFLRFRNRAPSAALFADEPRLALQASRALAVAILLFDVTLMLVSRDVWRDLTLEKSRLAFANQVAAILPAHAPVFAAPELDNTDVTVIAYRLGREIRRKPLTCGDRNDYYLSPLDSAQRAGNESRALASSEKADIALINLLSPSRVPQDSNCIRSSLHSIRYGDG